jgi:hypothetical protein
MALPKITHPVFKINIPSTKQTLSFRPYTVKEEKLLLFVKTEENISEVVDVLKQVINNCCVETIDTEKLALFDIEYIFVKLRAKSVDSNIELNYRKGEIVTPFVVDLNSVEVKFNPEKFPPRVVNATKKLDELEQAAYEKAKQGNLYKADIPDAAIPMMLDYDSPIKNQPQLYEIVRQSITDPDIRKTFEFNAEKGITGANVYKNYIDGKTDAERSANAAKLGITGIRYLDQGSRAEGKGTSNFVVFRPETVEILERNGVPTRKELLQQEFDKLDK